MSSVYLHKFCSMLHHYVNNYIHLAKKLKMVLGVVSAATFPDAIRVLWLATLFKTWPFSPCSSQDADKIYNSRAIGFLGRKYFYVFFICTHSSKLWIKSKCNWNKLIRIDWLATLHDREFLCLVLLKNSSYYVDG